MAKSSGTKGFVWGALAGGLLASAASLLLAPKSGRELRGDIAEGAKKAGEAAGKFAGQIGEGASKAAEQVGTSTTRFVDCIASGASGMADKAKEAAGGVAASIKDWRGKSETAAISGIAAASEASKAASDDCAETQPCDAAGREDQDSSGI